MDTGDLTDEQFSLVREKIGEALGTPTIGGSAVGSILGHNQYCIPEQFYDQKTGAYVPNKGDDWYLRAGHLLEANAVEMTSWWFKRERPDISVAIVSETGMYQHGETNPDGTLKYPWAVANPDRMAIVNGKKGGYEQKTCDASNTAAIRAIKDGIPKQENVDQCRFYMAVMNVDFWILSYWWGTGPNDIKTFFIHRDYEIEDKMMSICDDFVKHLIAGTKPEFQPVEPLSRLRYLTLKNGIGDSTKMIADLEPVAPAIETAYALDKEIEDTKQYLKALEKERNELAAEAADIIGDGVYGSCEFSDGTEVVVEMKRSQTKPSIDAERLKAEEPQLYEKYATKLDEALIKTAEPVIYAKYLIEPQISDPKKTKINITKRG